MQVKKQWLEPYMEQLTGSKSEKEHDKAVVTLFNLYTKHIMRNARLDELQAGIKIGGRNVNNLRWYHSNGRKQRGTKEPLDEGEGGEWKIF